MKLDEIRNEIDKIDKELVPLLKARMNCSIKVAEIKKAEGLPIYHPGREQAMAFPRRLSRSSLPLQAILREE